jgi:hypothetical protein
MTTIRKKIFKKYFIYGMLLEQLKLWRGYVL